MYKRIISKIYYSKVLIYLEKLVYLIGGRIPWSLFYLSYRNGEIKDAISLENNIFKNKEKLPDKFGFGLDERIIEYPWILSSVPKKCIDIFDAGSILNNGSILENIALRGKNILISNLNPEPDNYNDKSISYLYGTYGDLRNNIIKNNIFDLVICGSVLEHIGMDNHKIYRNSNKFIEENIEDYILVIKEFYRILRPGGTCLITVPYGINENFGWFQVFNSFMINKITKIFGEKNSSVDIYQYTDKGWQISDINKCKNATYFDIHKNIKYLNNRQAAAGAVACIKMTKI
jgi:ubiquinone/menaquinone biosynthesis C-methylase UbiE